MSRRRGIILGSILFIAVITVVVVINLRTFKTRDLRPSTYSPAPDGCKALYLLMEELNLPAQRLRKPFTRLFSHKGVLVAVNPRRVPYSKRELRKLRYWIKNGNRVVIFAGLPMRLFREDNRITDEEDTKKIKGKNKKKTNPFLISSSDIADYFGLTLTGEGIERSRSAKVNLPELQRNVEVNISTDSRWKKPGKQWKIIGEDSYGPVVLVRKLGKGSIAAISDCTLPTNRNIDLKDNLKLVMALILGKKEPKEILFDEYHHGHILVDKLSGYVASTVFAWILFQGLVGLVLYCYSRRARQSGRYLPTSKPIGRSSLEHVDSIAHIFESRKAGSAALEAIYKRFVAQTARRTGARPIDLDSKDSRIPARYGDSHDLRSIMADCRAFIKSEGNPDQALTIAKRLAETADSMRQKRVIQPVKRR